MALPTAPCTNCKATIVLGEPKCRKCAQPFQYGNRQVTPPTPDQIREALLAAAGAALTGPQTPSPAPVNAQPRAVTPRAIAAQAAPQRAKMPAASGPGGAAAWVDSGRAAEVAEVSPEQIPGFIDSTLFAPYSKAEVANDDMPGLERHGAPETSAPPADMAMAAVLDTGRAAEVAEVSPEQIPGFIDSTLFAKFTPASVESAPMPGLEVSPSAAAVAQPRRLRLPRAESEDKPATCKECGVPFSHGKCPACGARAPNP